jgi:hypothetical protein
MGTQFTSGHGTVLISTVHPNPFANSIKLFVVTLFKIDELSGTTKVFPSFV